MILNITDAILIHTQADAGRMPICVSPKCLMLLASGHLSGRGRAPLGSDARIRAHRKAIHPPISLN